MRRKSTYTNKYLAFESHSPVQSKRAMIKTVMDRAKYHPSTSERKQTEKQVISDLKVNEYPRSFIQRCLDSAQVDKKSRESEGFRLNSLCKECFRESPTCT